jgi:hypothetical protein
MSESTLDPDNFPLGADREVGKGHGTGALGPSDSSDSGSDVVGEAGLDSDTDAQGTGERGAVERDTVESGADIDTDHVETLPGEEGALVDEGMKEGEVERAAADRR